MNDNRSSNEPLIESLTESLTESLKENISNMEDNKKPHENNAVKNALDNELKVDGKLKKKEKSKKSKKPRCQYYDVHNKCKCRKKLSIIQASTNKCKCGKVFCDAHRQAESHFCEFDFRIKDKEMYERKHGLGGGQFSKISII